MSEEKIFIGSAKIINTKYGDLTKGSMHKEDINKIVRHMKDNNLDWINFVIKEKKEKVEGKPTHYIEIDTWKPEPQEHKYESDTINPEPEQTGLPF